MYIRPNVQVSLIEKGRIPISSIGILESQYLYKKTLYFVDMYLLLGVAVMPKTANINKMHSINILHTRYLLVFNCNNTVKLILLVTNCIL